MIQFQIQQCYFQCDLLSFNIKAFNIETTSCNYANLGYLTAILPLISGKVLLGLEGQTKR